jgi:NitT/TauT family transport system permease protein
MRIRLKRLFKWIRGVFIPLIAVMLWHWVAVSGWVNPLILPSPIQVLSKWWEYVCPLTPYTKGNYLLWLLSGELIQDTSASFFRVTVGFLIGLGLALPLGLVMGASTQLYNVLNPLLQILRPIPPIAYIPLAILWFGLGNPPAFFLISLGAFFPILMNTGLRVI